MCIQNLKTLALIEAQKSVTEIFIAEKEKWTNKWRDKKGEAEIIPKICTKFQNPRFSSSREIVDEKECLHTHPHTNIVTEKTKNIPGSLYTSYTRDINNGR